MYNQSLTHPHNAWPADCFYLHICMYIWVSEYIDMYVCTYGTIDSREASKINRKTLSARPNKPKARTQLTETAMRPIQSDQRQRSKRAENSGSSARKKENALSRCYAFPNAVHSEKTVSKLSSLATNRIQKYLLYT